MKDKLLIIAGPSGVGKTNLSIQLAKKFNGEIISSDSMQIYKGFDIGTAKITQDEMQDIKHYMIDICSSNQKYDVCQYKDETQKLIMEINKANKLPIMVGGTGLYINSVVYDYNFCNKINNNDTRDFYNIFSKKYGNQFLIWELDKQKISHSRISFHDTKRLIRLLETNGESGNATKEDTSKYDFLYICLTRDREKLYNSLNDRVELMFEKGLLKEIQTLLQNGIKWDCQAMQSIGYKEFKEYFENIIDINTVKEQIKLNTKRYAKRQLTWFRNTDGVIMYDVDNGFDKLFQIIEQWIKS